MKSIKNVVLFYTFLMVCAVVMQSCCTDENQIIGSGTIDVFEVDSFTKLDTIGGPFKLVINYETTTVGNFTDFNIIASSYALTCEENYINSIDESSLKISCDKDFTYDGDIISANTNFLTIPEMKRDLTADFIIELSIFFEAAFINNATFEEGTHTFKVESKTSDGLDLVNEIALEMAM